MNNTYHTYHTSHSWPITSLLKELKLKVIRQIVDGLETKGFWIPDEEYSQILQFRKEQANIIRQRLITPALGEADDSILNSPSLFGPNKDFAFNISTPIIFGHDIGNILYGQWAPDGDKRRRVTDLCALFNFGITLFDRVCDFYKTNPKVFSNIFGEQDLIDLFETPQGYIKVAESANYIVLSELRILLKVICLFFLNLHQLNAASCNPRDWANLKTMLVEAYRAQIQASFFNKYDFERQFDICRKKSTLPFLVMSQLCKVSGGGTASNAHSINVMSEIIASIFWQLDDLVDITKDIQSEDVNSVLLLAGDKYGTDSFSKEDFARLLLTGPDTEILVKDFCLQLADLFSSFNDGTDETVSGIQFSDLIKTYIRNWLPKRLFMNVHH